MTSAQQLSKRYDRSTRPGEVIRDLIAAGPGSFVVLPYEFAAAVRSQASNHAARVSIKRMGAWSSAPAAIVYLGQNPKLAARLAMMKRRHPAPASGAGVRSRGMIAVSGNAHDPKLMSVRWARWLARHYPLELAIALRRLPTDPNTDMPRGLPIPPITVLLTPGADDDYDGHGVELPKIH